MNVQTQTYFSVFALRAVSCFGLIRMFMMCDKIQQKQEQAQRCSNVCVCVCFLVLLNTELTSSICVLGVCGARGPQPNKPRVVWMLNVGAPLRVSRCTLQPPHSGATTHSTPSILWLHCSEEHTHTHTHSGSSAVAGAYLSMQKPGDYVHDDTLRPAYEAYWLSSMTTMSSLFSPRLKLQYSVSLGDTVTVWLSVWQILKVTFGYLHISFF